MEKVGHLFTDDRRVQHPRLRAVLQAERVQLVVLLLERVARRRELGDPCLARAARERLGQGFEERALVAHDSQIERPVPSEIFGSRMHPNHLRIGTELPFPDIRHLVLTHDDDQVDAEQRFLGGVG